MDYLFRKAYKEHYKAILKHCFYKTSSIDLAEEFTQEAFTKVYGYLKRGNKIDNFKAFLFRTANNLIIDWYRKKKTLSLELLVDDGFNPAYHPKMEVEDIFDAKIFLQYIDELSPLHAQVIQLSLIKELRVKEIARFLNETENNISVRLHRAFNKLRQIHAERT